MIIILTGCIEPGNVYNLKLRDCNERLRQYQKAIQYYIRCNSINKVVFCDNSAFSYDYKKEYQIAQKYNKQLEVLSYREDDAKTQKKGKGYGEGRILEYVLSHSSLLRTEIYFYKVTGRLIVRNIDQIIGREVTRNNYFNKNLYTYNTIDTRFFGINKEIYQRYFLHAYEMVNDRHGRYLEHCFIQIMNRNRIPYRCHALFPDIEGISGTLGEKYVEAGRAGRCLYNCLSRLNLYNKKYGYEAVFRIHRRLVNRSSFSRLPEAR